MLGRKYLIHPMGRVIVRLMARVVQSVLFALNASPLVPGANITLSWPSSGALAWDAIFGGKACSDSFRRTPLSLIVVVPRSEFASLSRLRTGRLEVNVAYQVSALRLVQCQKSNHNPSKKV
jgi:hypothetical protein